MKADDKSDVGDGEVAEYTNFEYLQAKVDALEEVLEQVTKALKDNNIQVINKTDPADLDVLNRTIDNLPEE